MLTKSVVEVMSFEILRLLWVMVEKISECHGAMPSKRKVVKRTYLEEERICSRSAAGGTWQNTPVRKCAGGPHTCGRKRHTFAARDPCPSSTHSSFSELGGQADASELLEAGELLTVGSNALVEALSDQCWLVGG